MNDRRSRAPNWATVVNHAARKQLIPEVAKAVEQVIGELRKITNSVIETKLPPAAPMTPILGAEAYAYHSKWIAESPDRYQPLTRDRIIGLAADVKAPAAAEALHQPQPAPSGNHEGIFECGLADHPYHASPGGDLCAE